MDDIDTPPDGIPLADWLATPASVRLLVTVLLTRIQTFEQRLNQTSQTSSKPPSSDPPSAPPRPPATPRGRKAGGQPGHPGHTRPRREPDQIVPLRPTTCPTCQADLPSTLPDAAPPIVTQVWDVPPIRPVIIDYHQHTVICPCCQTRTTAAPAPAAATGYGARVTALVGHLHGTYHLRVRAIADLLADVADLPLSTGSVVASFLRVSTALIPIDAAIHTAVQTAPVVNVDETSWRETRQRCWLWTATTATVTTFRITASRGRAGLDAVLPADYGGIVGSDRWNAYNRYDDTRRQLCWAHLLRNVRALAEAHMPDSAWATALLGHIADLFAAWAPYRAGTTGRAGLATALAPIQQAIQTALADGLTRRWHKVGALSRELLAHWDALWTFATHDGVDPTNNAAERALRPAVIWRKQCFGTHSADGSRFVERIRSVVTTCRQQGRNVWQVLTEAVVATMTGHPPPSLLPAP